MHCAFGSQLIYNRQSGLSLFMGALSADKLLTVFRFEWTHPNKHTRGISVTGTVPTVYVPSAKGTFGNPK